MILLFFLKKNKVNIYNLDKTRKKIKIEREKKQSFIETIPLSQEARAAPPPPKSEKREEKGKKKCRKLGGTGNYRQLVR